MLVVFWRHFVSLRLVLANSNQVMEAYSLATSTLNTILANPALDLDRINATTESLAEAMASQEEVDEAVRAVGAGARMEVDEDELEVELRGLVEEEKARILAKKKKAELREERRKAEEERKVEEKKRKEEAKKREEVEKREEERKEAEKRKAKAETMARAKDAERHADVNDQWEGRYEAAQQREQEEKKRAEAERLRKEEQRVAAE